MAPQNGIEADQIVEATGRCSCRALSAPRTSTRWPKACASTRSSRRTSLPRTPRSPRSRPTRPGDSAATDPCDRPCADKLSARRAPHGRVAIRLTAAVTRPTAWSLHGDPATGTMAPNRNHVEANYEDRSSGFYRADDTRRRACERRAATRSCAAPRSRDHSPKPREWSLSSGWPIGCPDRICRCKERQRPGDRNNHRSNFQFREGNSVGK